MNPARYLLFPWWVAQLGTGAKSFVDNPLIGSTRLNMMGLHVARVRAAQALAAARRRRLAHLVDAADRAALDRDGYVVKRDFLPPAQFEALRDQVMNRRSAAREVVQGDTVTRRIAIDPAMLAALPAVRALLDHPVWRGLLRYVWSFDVEPDSYIQTILPGAYAAPPDPQTVLHADTFHPTAKAWLFLTDVAPDEGPFVYVPGSHRMTERRIAWERRRSLDARRRDTLSARGSLRVEADELGALGLPAPVSFAVPANTLVVADTSGFHARGPSVRPSTRVEIWAFGRRNPFVPWTGFDARNLAWPGARRVPLMWAARDLIAPIVGNPWVDAGPRRPADPWP